MVRPSDHSVRPVTAARTYALQSESPVLPGSRVQLFYVWPGALVLARRTAAATTEASTTSSSETASPAKAATRAEVGSFWDDLYGRGGDHPVIATLTEYGNPYPIRQVRYRSLGGLPDRGILAD